MINKTILQGRLVRDPELNTTASGVEVAKFTVAWSEKFKDTETKCFLNCVAWRQTGVFVNQYFEKGQEIVVEGKITSRDYEDKSGNKRTAFELVCDQVHFCGSKASNSNSKADVQHTYSAPPPVSYGTPSQPAQNAYVQTGFTAVPAPSDDDLPF